MIDIKTAELRQMEKDLRLFNSRALPYATRRTVNDLAFLGRGRWQGQIDEKLINRNKWTKQGVRVQKTRTLDIGRQRSTLGHLEPYMERQEFGGTVVGQGKEGHPIATTYASREGMTARVRKRLPVKSNKMRNIQLRDQRIRAANRRQRNAIAVQQAVKSGRRFVWLDLGRTKGIFRVVGGKKNPQLRMVWDLSNRSVRTPATPTLQPTLDSMTPGEAALLYRKALRFQLRRHGILGY